MLPTIAIVPFSGGSSLEANFAAPFGGMSVDFTFMNKIIALNAEEYVIVLSIDGQEKRSLHVEAWM